MENNTPVLLNPNYEGLLEKISFSYVNAQATAARAVNFAMLEAYWEIGKYIVEFEQKGNAKAAYGQKLLETLSRDLTRLHGKGFSLSNLKRMRQLYFVYPISAMPSHHLSWSHYVELLKIDDPLERDFYEKQAILENWSIAELMRQKKAALFLRLAASMNKHEIKELSQKGRQYRITLGNRHHRVDLVFYHRILKCFVLIDIKIKEAGYEDIGQMNMYLGYFKAEENTTGGNPPIGIILAKEKDELLIEYAVHGMSARLFVQKYQLYLPDESELRREIEKVYARTPDTQP